jgi:hypothetical protein
MSLQTLIRRGVSTSPLRILLYGVEGIGKTTFAADAPNPIFLGSEDGSGQLDIQRLPPVRKWEDVHEYVGLLTDDAHDFKTVVIDTVDHLERICWNYVCEQARAPSIEKVDGGFGKGYTAAVEEWTRLYDALDRLRTKRGMHVLALGHAHVKAFNDPQGPAYDRYQLRMNEKAAALWKERSDVVLFANYATSVAVQGHWGDRALTDKQLLSKGKVREQQARRVIYTTRTPAYDAKNRHDLPAEIPLSWGAFARAIKIEQRGGDNPTDAAAKLASARDILRRTWHARLTEIGVALDDEQRGKIQAELFGKANLNDVDPAEARKRLADRKLQLTVPKDATDDQRATLDEALRATVHAILDGTPAPAPVDAAPVAEPAPSASAPTLAPAPAPAAPAPAAPTLVPTTTEHESWAAAKDGFLAALANLQVDILELSTFCGAKGKPAPHCLADRSRAALLEQLRDPAIREKYDAWVGEYRERTAIQGEPTSAAAK